MHKLLSLLALGRVRPCSLVRRLFLCLNLCSLCYNGATLLLHQGPQSTNFSVRTEWYSNLIVASRLTLQISLLEQSDIARNLCLIHNGTSLAIFNTPTIDWCVSRFSFRFLWNTIVKYIIYALCKIENINLSPHFSEQKWTIIKA